jgi:hypothetical protein
MNSDNTVTTIASENIRDLWKVLDNTPGKGPSAASKILILDLVIILNIFKFIESSTMNINAQRKALTARTTRTSNQQQQPVGSRGGGRGGSTRGKIRNWNARDD